MRGQLRGILHAMLLVTLVAVAPGCVAAAVAGAGAAAAVHMTDNGAESVVPASLEVTDRRTQAALSAMGITVHNRQSERGEFEYHGEGNGMDVHVELEARDAGNTLVKVSARRNAVDYDKDYARSIVQRIANTR